MSRTNRPGRWCALREGEVRRCATAVRRAMKTMRNHGVGTRRRDSGDGVLKTCEFVLATASANCGLLRLPRADCTAKPRRSGLLADQQSPRCQLERAGIGENKTLESAGSTLQSGCSGTPLHLAARQVHPLPVVAAMPETGRPCEHLAGCHRAGVGKAMTRHFQPLPDKKHGRLATRFIHDG